MSIAFWVIGLVFAVIFVSSLIFGGLVFTHVFRMFQGSRKYGGGVVGQVLAMKEQLEEQLTVDCSFCGGKRPRDGRACPNCGATPPGM